MALFRGIQEYIALDANNITLVFDSGNIVNISGNIFLYPPQGHPILYKSPKWKDVYYPKWEVVLGALDSVNIPCLMHDTLNYIYLCVHIFRIIKIYFIDRDCL